MCERVAPELGRFGIANRKYLGAKTRLLPFLEQVIGQCADGSGVFADLFAGTGVVADHFCRLGWAVLLNDNLLCNHIPHRVFFASRREEMDPQRVQEHLLTMNALPGRGGYVQEHFSDTYFTRQNAARLDAMREYLDSPATSGCTASERDWLLTSLLYAADKAANTCGQYDAFLKHIGSAPHDNDGTHRVDANVYKPIRLAMPQVVFDRPAQVHYEDVNALVRGIESDVLYLDPPYNHRQYIDCYHLLENLARWEKPPLRGRTRKFARQALKSPYSQRQRAESSLADLVGAARCGHIFLSYNSKGLISDEAIRAILSTRGSVEEFSTEYPVFGRGAGRARKLPLRERVFWCRVSAAPTRHCR